MSDTSRLHRIKRLCALWVAVSYCCLSLLVPFHQHMNVVSSRGEGTSKQLLVRQNSHSWSDRSVAANTHCAACEWEAIVGSQITPEFVLQPIAHGVIPAVIADARAMRSVLLETSSRGPPRA